MNVSRRIIPLLALLAAGCMTGPRPVNYAPGDYLTANQPGQVWVTLNNGNEMVIAGPKVITDTIFGWTVEGEDLMVAVSDIREIRVRRMDPLRTALIPATVAVGAAAVVMLVSNDGTGAPRSYAACLEEQEEGC